VDAGGDAGMTYTISKDFTFSASHQLHRLADDHPCGRLHGHNYTVRVELTGPLDPRTGFVLDYGALAPIKAYLDDILDHRHLNDVVTFQPSAENLARYLFYRVREQVEIPRDVAVAVGVSETPKTWAWWRP
jgi:6-pyruvoyltetrahydropterin/6-carboxytetrahydropterin synthase